NDPVSSGFVESLAQPGGNITGFSLFEYSFSGKWLELLKELSPRVMRAAILRDLGFASGSGQLGAIQSVAPSLGAEVIPLSVSDAGVIERALAAFARSPNGGMIVTGSTLAFVHRKLIITLAARHRLPAVYPRPIHRQRRLDFLRDGFDRSVSPRRRLCRSHPQRRENRRPSGAGADQVRARRQPQDRQGPWTRN